MAEPTPEAIEALRIELSRYESEMLPGAVSRLVAGPAKELAQWREPWKLAKEVNVFMRSDRSKLFKKVTGPETKPPHDVLRAVLARNADRLKDGGVERLYDRLALDLAHRPEPEIAERVARYLTGREANDCLKVPIPAPVEVRTVLEALKPWERQLRHGVAQELSELWQDIGRFHSDPGKVAVLIRSRLALPGNAKYLLRAPFDASNYERPSNGQVNERPQGPSGVDRPPATARHGIWERTNPSRPSDDSQERKLFRM